MKGELLVLYPRGLPDLRKYIGPLPRDLLNELVDGTIAQIPLFDHIVTFDGVPSKAVAFCNEEAIMLNMQDNFWASAIWHYIIRSKGEKRLPTMLKGPVVIITGDDEFLEEIYGS